MPESYQVLLVFVVALLALSFFSSRLRRKQAKAVSQMREELTPGTEVMTSTGFLGYVIQVSEDEIVLESEPGGARTRWVPQAISRRITPLNEVDLPPAD